MRMTLGSCESPPVRPPAIERESFTSFCLIVGSCGVGVVVRQLRESGRGGCLRQEGCAPARLTSGGRVKVEAEGEGVSFGGSNSEEAVEVR